MAQNFTPDWYELTFVADTAFQNAENNDNTLRSNFSGSNAPSNPIAGQQWFDIDTGTMKVREIDSTWLAMLVGAATFRMWLYTNDQQRGMLIDATVTDVVIAFRGGNYGSSGGVVVGNWSISGLTNSQEGNHSHRWKRYTPNNDYTWDAAQGAILLQGNTVERQGIVVLVTQGNSNCQNSDYYTEETGQHLHLISHNALWRPQAAVGTMQYPNLA